MTRKITLAISLVLISLFCYSQQVLFEKNVGNGYDEEAYSAVENANGELIIVGKRATPTYSYDVLIMKTDQNGDTIWTKTYGGDYIDYAKSIHETPNGNYIIAGVTQYSGIGKYDVYMLKINDDGDTLWTRTFGDSFDEYAYSVDVSSDGGYIVGGTKEKSADNYKDFLLKINSNGDSVWASVGATNGSSINYVNVLDDEKILAAGSTSDVNYWDVLIARFNTDGSKYWNSSFQWGANNYDYGDAANWAKKVSSNKYVFAGYTHSSPGTPLGWFTTAETGVNDFVYSKNRHGAVFNSAAGILDTGYVFVGSEYDNGSPSRFNGLVIFTEDNSYLTERETMVFGEVDRNDELHSVIPTKDGNYVIIGHTRSFSDDVDVYIIKIGPGENSIQESNNIHDLKIYPNPTKDIINIETSKLLSVTIYNLNGQIIKTVQSKNNKVEINLQNKSRGIYFARIISENGLINKKIVLK